MRRKPDDCAGFASIFAVEGGVMALVRKEARRIVVDGTAYRWRLRGRPTYFQGLASRRARSRSSTQTSLGQRSWSRPTSRTRVTELFQRCRSRVRTAAAIDVIRFRLLRDLRKMCQDFSRAAPRSTGARAADSVRLTVCRVGVSSRPGGRLKGVVTHGPAPM
jgi:hypothetical protein